MRPVASKRGQVGGQVVHGNPDAGHLRREVLELQLLLEEPVPFFLLERPWRLQPDPHGEVQWRDAAIARVDSVQKGDFQQIVNALLDSHVADHMERFDQVSLFSLLTGTCASAGGARRLGG